MMDDYPWTKIKIHQLYLKLIFVRRYELKVGSYVGEVIEKMADSHNTPGRYVIFEKRFVTAQMNDR